MIIREVQFHARHAPRQYSSSSTSSTFNLATVLIPMVIAVGITITIGTMLYRCVQRGQSIYAFRNQSVPQQRIDLNPTSAAIRATHTPRITPYVPATLPNSALHISNYSTTPLSPNRVTTSIGGFGVRWEVLGEPVPARPAAAHVHNGVQRHGGESEPPPAYSPQDPVVRVL